MHGRRMAALLFAIPSWAGELQGSVKILDREGKPRPTLKDCVAILEPAGTLVAKRSPSKPLSIRTVGKQFVPRVSIVTPGTEVTFPNLDPILHNVFSVTPGNRFDTGHYLPGDCPRVRLQNLGLVKLYCNIHHQMNAFAWVVETPYAQLIEGKVGVHFTGVVPGNYRLRLWHPECGDKVWSITIGEGITKGEWILSTSLPAVEPHKNKFGRDYPPPHDDGGY